MIYISISDVSFLFMWFYLSAQYVTIADSWLMILVETVERLAMVVVVFHCFELAAFVGWTTIRNLLPVTDAYSTLKTAKIAVMVTFICLECRQLNRSLRRLLSKRRASGNRVALILSRYRRQHQQLITLVRM